MCGRFTRMYSWAELHRLLSLGGMPYEAMVASYNVAPTQTSPIVRADAAGARAGVLARWGLVPAWAKDLAIGNRAINARAETVAEKPMFREAFRSRRCVVPVSGFYEWRAGAGAKVPHYIHRADGAPLLFAGLWELWGGGADTVESFTIITTGAPDWFRDLHERIPAVLEPEGVGAWLGAPDAALLRPPAAGVLAWHAVSTRVNAPRNDGPDLVEPVTA